MDCSINGVLSSETATQPYILERILKKRQAVIKSRTDIFWSTVNFCVAFGLCFEMSFGDYLLTRNYYNSAVWLTASAILVLCSSSFVIYFLSFMKYWFVSTPLELTESQQKLFGVSDSEPGFQIIRQAPVSMSKTNPTAGPNYSPSVYTGRLSHQCSPSPSRSVRWLDQSMPTSTGIFSSPSLLSSRQGSRHSTPPNFSNSCSPFASGSPGFLFGSNCGRSSPSASPRFDGSSGSLSASFNSSSLPANQSSSPVHVTSNLLTASVLAEMTGVKTKSRSPTVSPLRTDNCIQDLNTLDSYFREQQEKETKPAPADVSTFSPGHSSFWSYGRSSNDQPTMGQYQYQLAPRSTQSSAGADDSSFQTDSPSCEHVWTKLGVTSDQLDQWVENLRKWLGKTILAPLVTEIDEINRLLVSHGSDDVQIGEASLTSLKQLSAVKSQLVPQLVTLIPYIDMLPNQEYLIQRIRDLANGGCISAFKWNGGAEFKGKRWEETLPTDSAILIHLLCSYLDARLPGHPKFPDGKTFTSQHFIKTPDKPNLVDRKDNLCIYQTRINSPHFKVVIEDTVWNVKEGRHNLFHAILVFLYHIQTKEHGMLRRINLGMSGINIAWVFQQ